MERMTAEEREHDRIARQAKRRVAKANKKARPAKIAPLRTDRPAFGLRERRPQQKDKKRLAWARRLPCLACLRRGRSPLGPSDAAHVRHRYPEEGWTYTGKSEKCDDWRTVGFCRPCHEEERDRRDETAFWRDELRLYPPAAVARLQAAYEAGEDGAQVILEIARWETDRG